MGKKCVGIIIFLLMILFASVVVSNAATTAIEPSEIIYPIPSENKNGKIIYEILYDGTKEDLQFRQNKTWKMTKLDRGQGTMLVEITVPYTEINENFSIPTTISHQLTVYPKGYYSAKVVYEAEFKVPVMKFAGIRNRTVNLDVGEDTVLNVVTSKLQLKANPDTDEGYDYIWDNLKIQASNGNVVKFGDILSNKINGTIKVTLIGVGAGKSEISLLSPTNQLVKVANVTVKGEEIEKPTITGTRKIEKPNAFKKEDGYIEYTITHKNVSLSDLKITQNKDYKMTKTRIDSDTSKIKVVIPYNEVDTSANSTTINHELYISYSSETTNLQNTFSTMMNITRFEIKEEKYFCNVKTLSKKENIKHFWEEEKEFTIINKNGQTLNETENISTGMKIKFDNQEYEISVTGDTDGDGKITILDVAKVQLHCVKLENLEGAYLKAADTDASSDISILDVAQVLLAYVGLREI